MEVTTDFKSYHERIQKALVETSHSVKQVTDNRDLSFHRSANDKVAKSLDSQNAHLLRLTNKLLKAATQDTEIKPPSLRDQDDIEDKWREVVDVVDDLLEKADTTLDEFTGVVKRFSPKPQSGAQTPVKQQDQKSRSPFARSDDKPQKFFQRKPDNFDTNPFRPILTKKPHAIRPLEDSIGSGSPSYGHPYAHEIEQYRYPPSVYQISPPVPFTPPEDSSAVWVDTIDGLIDMVQELKAASEIAVDLEHHDRRSYVGIVSLMQISTRTKDWIVDTLKPWREELQILNQVFADPKILKVFHGSSMDMIWLQRDLGLYVVGLFDTYYACEALQFPGRSLKYLLATFANFEAQKQYQTADWRVRPLSTELLDYARADTHYLLHVYDHVRNLLIQKSTPENNLTDLVLEQSKKEALQTYERFVYDAESGRGSHGWYGLFTEHTVNFTPSQFAAFLAVHEWRDKKARELDESTGFVLPNHLLWPIAENMPCNMYELSRCCRPVTPILKSHCSELFGLIKKAKHETSQERTVYDILRENEAKYGVVRNKWRRPKEEQNKSQLTGIAATLQRLARNGDVDASQGPLPTVDRAQHSTLYGNITTHTPQVALDLKVASAALSTTLPLPDLSEAAFSETTATNFALPGSVSMPTTPSQSNSISTTPRERDEVFTLRERSRKRKADEAISELTQDQTPNGNPPPPNLVGTTNEAETETQRATKAQRKAEKQAKKEAKKVAADAKAAATVPFDYAAAESLLTPSTVPHSEAKSNGVKPMNPFAKALDTSTGAKRQKAGKEKSGRSMTFQS